MLNIPYGLRPKSWGEYFGHDKQIARMKSWVSNSPESLPRAIFVSGHSGVGKTAAVMLLIKSIHCTERKKGSSDPCGECESCKSVDARLSDRSFSNVHWVQPGGFTEETVQASVKNALAAGSRGPDSHSADPSRDVLFLVFDEWHKIDSRSRQQVLIRSEVETPHNVCYVFITMMADQLPFMDRVALQARCQCVNLLPFSSASIESYLKERLNDPKTDDSAIKVISENSEGSLRQAISLWSTCKGLDDYVTEEIACEAVQCATNKSRKELWQLIESNETSGYTLKQEVEKVMQTCDHAKLVKQLLNDLYAADEATQRWEAVRCLSMYRGPSSSAIDVISMLKVLGVKGVCKSIAENTPIPRLLETHIQKESTFER